MMLKAADASAARRPRAQSLQAPPQTHAHAQTAALGSPAACGVARECCSSGSFVSKLYRMVDSEPSSIVSWIRGGSAFCIVDPKMLAEHCLPKYFRHRRFSSLIRQLNFYSFYRVQEGQLTIYQHSFFRKGRPDLLVHIKRRGAGKAKDPWFDPLASSPKMDAAAAPCYSPMAKPLSIENMSPALKPGLAPSLAPPAVDLGAPAQLESKRWEIKREDDLAYPLASAVQMKHELFFGDVSPMVRPSVPSPLDLDIQDFLTDECAINPSGAMDAACGMDPRCALVSRDLMALAPAPTLLSQDDEGDRAFEDELLLDLATVEPEAWEVPLSPLNEAEEVSWGDLCF